MANRPCNSSSSSFARMLLLAVVIVVCVLVIGCPRVAWSVEVSHEGRAITIDGQRRVLLSGSIHYTRSTPEMWEDLINKAKEGGLDAIDTYVFWNAHEPLRRQYDFTGNLDLIKFIKTVQSLGLYLVLHIGPYICSEWNYGGFPAWLHNLPGIELRTLNQIYMDEMQNFTTLIVNMVKKEKLFASQGGPIILAQIENGYGYVMSGYGDAGKAYVNWCSKLAKSQKIGIPWIMSQQSDAPQPMIDTCIGFYCDSFKPNNPNSPKIWTENWTGWFKNWGGKDPHRTAEDLAFAVARFFQYEGTFQNYYMYHGGTNFGRTTGGPYVATSYDYDAPLDEYGNLNQPKWGHLKELHSVLKSMEFTLTQGNITHNEYDSGLSVSIYAAANGTSSCFFGNANTTTDATLNFRDKDYFVPAWSVSILPDCKTEVYNTAKVNAQTTLMVLKSNEEEDEPQALQWAWRPESIDDVTLLGKGSLSSNQLLDQKFSNDVSDYLWYMTSINIDAKDPILNNITILRVNNTGQVIHAYVNGNYLGSEWSTSYGTFKNVFEREVKLNPGKQQISLLSATVGLQNYGPKFDTVGTGILGPVELVGRKDNETIIKDLSKNTWSYKIGLNGVDSMLHTSNKTGPAAADGKWHSNDLPIFRMMTWYKTSFKAPLGTDPVALYLQGLGKGFAWVNGHSIGRYWPSSITDDNGCSLEPCDYRGSYDNNKCVTNCGQPTQSLYHVPRSFLSRDENTLVLFKEFGGNPSLVSFNTVVPGSVCGNVYENKTLELSCQGRPIKDIAFAAFGEVHGSCGSFRAGSCQGANNAKNIIENACVGKDTCSVAATEDVFAAATEAATCADLQKKKKLAVEAVC